MSAAELRFLAADGRVIHVVPGFGMWMVGWTTGHGNHRVRSKLCPPRQTYAEAKQDLISFAAKYRLQEVPA